MRFSEQFASRILGLPAWEYAANAGQGGARQDRTEQREQGGDMPVGLRSADCLPACLSHGHHCHPPNQPQQAHLTPLRARPGNSIASHPLAQAKQPAKCSSRQASTQPQPRCAGRTYGNPARPGHTHNLSLPRPTYLLLRCTPSIRRGRR